MPPRKLVHEGINPDEKTGAILTPIVQSTAFVQESVDMYMVGGYEGQVLEATHV